MQLNSVLNWYLKFKENHFVLCYMGEFDDELTSILMEVSESCKTDRKSTKKKVSYLIAECFQNIVRHSDKKNLIAATNLGKEMFAIRDYADYHQIITSNFIQKQFIENLKSRLEELQKLDHEALQKKYIETFENDRTARGGAGLGLLDIARKSGSKPSYAFVDVNNAISNFFMEVNIIPKSEENNATFIDKSLFDKIQLYEQLANEDIIILQKGDFSQEAILPIISMFENNLQLMQIGQGIGGKIIYLLIEMLQNITRHSVVIEGNKEGVFYIANNHENNYIIRTGNFISSEDAKLIGARLNEIINLDKIALSKKYKAQLMDMDASEDHGAGIGLIEICRLSSEKIIYDIRTINDDLAFFSLEVKI